MLYIKHGSIFDEKCDLLVLPCNSAGGVTNWVESEIRKYNLPFPHTHIPFGMILFLESGNKYKKSNYLGYAASVDHKDSSSSLDAISNILTEIIKYCDETKSSLVNIPAFGTGAGSLDHADVMQLYEEKLTRNNITFNVFLPDLRLAKLFGTEDSTQTIQDALRYDNPRVFISYAWGDENIRKWSVELAEKLCADGVNARIDKYHLKPGFDMPQWMTDELVKANKVLLICDQFYAEKADTRKAGVGWETMIVQGDMLLQGINNKYIAIACGGFDKNIPIYMKSKLAITKEEVDKDIKILLVHLFDVDIAPQIGQIPNWIKEKLHKRIV